MRKKIALFGLGLALAVGGFSTYWYVTGINPFHGGAKPAGHGTGELPTGQGTNTLHFEDRTDEGALKYVLECDRADQDPNVPGRYTLKRPKATYFLPKDERIVVLTADEGTVLVDQPRGKTGKATPKGGSLTGNVMLTIGPAASFAPDATEAEKQQIRARLLQDVEFDYARREIFSPGPIRVRSDQVEFDGENLTVAFNREARRIDYLRIERGDKIIVRKIAKESPEGLSFGGRGPAAGAPVANGTPGAVAPPPAAAAKPADLSTTYRLSFGQNVKALVGPRTISSQHMYIVFQAGAGDVTTRPATGARPAPATTLAVAPAHTAPAATAPIKPLAEPGAEDLVVTWTGPLEMRPAEATVGLASNKDALFEAVGSAQEPVTIHDGPTRTAKAGRVTYHVATQQLAMEPGTGAAKTVEMSDPAMGTLLCAGLSYDQLNGALHVTGPGRLEAFEGAMRENGAATDGTNGTRKPPVVATWSRTLEVLLAQVADPKNPKKNIPIIKHATLTGDADIREPSSFWIHGQSIDAAVAQVTRKPGARPSPVIEHLLASGGVQVETYRGPGGDKLPDGIAGDRLELKTKAGPTGPAPEVLLVDGQVKAVTYQLDKADKGAPKMRKSVLSTPNLVAYLEPKARDASAKDDGPRDAFGGVTVKRLAGANGVNVELEGFGQQPIVATANALEAQLKPDKALLKGKAGDPTSLVSIKQGESVIVGHEIALAGERDKQALDIAGPGNFTFYQAAKVDPVKGTQERPVKVNVAWTDAMHYGAKDREATFAGAVVTKLLDRPDQKSELTSDKLRVVFVARAGAKPGTDNALEGRPELAQVQAEGNVKVTGETLDDKGTLLTRMLLREVSQLTYANADGIMQIKGKGGLVMEDYRPENLKATTPPGGDNGGTRGKTWFVWRDGLTFASKTGEIHAVKDVQMVHEPTKPIRLEMPGANGKGGTPEVAKAVKMSCQDLKAFVLMPKGSEKTGSPLALGSNGQTRLTKVVADSDARLDIGDNWIQAASLEMNVDQSVATASSRGGQLVSYVWINQGAGQAQQITYNLKTGAWAANGATVTGTVPEIKLDR